MNQKTRLAISVAGRNGLYPANFCCLKSVSLIGLGAAQFMNKHFRRV